MLSIVWRQKPQLSPYRLLHSISTTPGFQVQRGILPAGVSSNSPSEPTMDTEGWHHGLNRRAQGKSQLPFYHLLVELLFQEAKLTSLQIRLVSDKKLKRIQRKEYRNVQARLFEAWDKYQNGDISVECLLKTASHLVASQI